jgi:tripartite-type tricarboxylate transporter receptor subunit TctC
MAIRVQPKTLAGAVLGLALLPSVGQAADPVIDFYKGKSLVITVGSDAGGGYDLYTRTLARHLGKHIPGNPNIVVKNMPGSGGTVMLNYLSVKAVADGAEIGAPYGASLIEPVLDKGKVTKYDSRKLNWVGNISGQVSACFTWKATSKVKTMEDARRIEAIMSATSANTPGAIGGVLFNLLAGTKFRVITGYSTAEKTLAIQRGEAEGTCQAYESLVTELPDWVRGPVVEHKVNWLAVMSDHESPNLKGVPPVTNYVAAEDDKQIVRIIERQLTMGRPYVAPSGVPADRLQAIRDGFMATMKDPDYLAEAKKQEMFVDPSDHVAMERLIDDTYAIPEAVISKALAMVDRAKSGEGMSKK